jgi:hypothetical protein
MLVTESTELDEGKVPGAPWPPLIQVKSLDVQGWLKLEELPRVMTAR